MAAKTCTPWMKERRASGSAPHVRHCGANRAEIVSGTGYYTFNVYRNGKWAQRGSAKTLKAAKTAATRKIS